MPQSGRQPRSEPGICPIVVTIKPRTAMAWAKMRHFNRLNIPLQHSKRCRIMNRIISNCLGNRLAWSGAAAARQSRWLRHSRADFCHIFTLKDCDIGSDDRGYYADWFRTTLAKICLAASRAGDASTPAIIDAPTTSWPRSASQWSSYSGSDQ